MSKIRSPKIKLKALLILFNFIILNSLSSNAQKLKLPEHQFENIISSVQVPEEFKKYPIVILEDKVYFNISTNSVSRYLRFKVLNDKASLNFNQFVMPQSFDISNEIFNEPRYKAEKIHYPMATLDLIKEFDMRVIKSDGSKIDISPKDSLVQYNFVHKQKTFKMFNVFFKIPELNKNDELEIFYRHEPSIYAITAYSSIIHDFYNYRIFFNNEHPKVNFELKIRAKANDAFKVSAHNYSNKIDSSVEKVGTLNDQIFVFNAKNLLPIGNKWNAINYENYSYVSYYSAGALQVFDEKNQFKEFKEYNWRFGLKMNSGFKYRYNGYDKTDVNTVALNNLHKHVFNTSKDTSIIAYVKTFNDYINDQFEYSNDVDYLTGADMRNINMGEHLNKKILRRYVSRKVYDQVLNRLDRVYYEVYSNDKRIASLDFDKYSLDSKFLGLYGIPYQGELHFISIKRHRFGHHIDELPFYYENTNIILVPQNVYTEDETFIKVDYLPKLIYYRTPSSNESDNQRVYNILAQVNVDSSIVNFNCKLKLNGQFSTLIRGNYTYEYVDSMVHSDYYRKVYQLSSNSKLDSKTKSYDSDLFPFTSNFNFKYSDKSIIKKLNDSLITFSLDNFIQHVIEKNIDTLVSNNFYFDFKQTDIFRYNLKFDQKVKLQNTDIQHNQKYSFGNYSFKISQISDNDILVESSLLIDNEKVSNNNLSQIISLNNKIAEIDNIVLNIKTLNQK